MTPLFSTAYFPPIAYVATLMQHPAALIEGKETFPKQTYRNRMEIMTAGGVRPLTVPVTRNNHSRTEEVSIDYKDRWNIIHLRTLEAAYSASPYYLYYKDDLERLLTHRYDRLIELNQTLLEWLLKKLKISCSVTLTADWEAPTGKTGDFRYLFTPKKPFSTGVLKPYYQVFGDRIPFTPDLSVLDLLFNLGPEAREYLEKTL